MRFISSFSDGMHIDDVYLCKAKSVSTTKNGREYGNLTLQDKTGQIDAKIWDLYSPGIREFEAMDFVRIDGRVQEYQGANQLSIMRISKADECEYNTSDYFPASEKPYNEMTAELKEILLSVKNPYLVELLKKFFGDRDFYRTFAEHSAAKSIHHGVIHGLMEHSISVARLCDFAASHYGFVNRDLLITGAILHDIGKIKELSPFPQNDYTDDGQLLGHVYMGASMIQEKIRAIDGFPPKLASELLHLILSHHGELEYGSPKKPALMEALILSYADIMDARVETMHEALRDKTTTNPDGWLGFNKNLESNIRKTSPEAN